MTQQVEIKFSETKSAIFERGKPKKFHIGDGFVMVSGKVRMADGSIHDALLEICEQDSGEHYGTGIWTSGGISFQDEKDFLKHITKTKEQVFPYVYTYKPNVIERDHHVGADGWSL